MGKHLHPGSIYILGEHEARRRATVSPQSHGGQEHRPGLHKTDAVNHAGHTGEEPGQGMPCSHLPPIVCSSGAFYYPKAIEQGDPTNKGQPPRRQRLMGNEEESLEGPMDYAEHSRLVGVPNLPSPKLSSGTFSCAPPDLRPLQPSPAWERHSQPAGGPDLKLGSCSQSSALLLSNLHSFGKSDSWASQAHAGAPSPSPCPLWNRRGELWQIRIPAAGP